MMGPISFSLLSLLATGLGGGLMLRQEGWAHRNLWRVLSFGSGVLIAITFLHLLPEAWTLNARVTSAAVLTALVGLLTAEQFTVVHACGEVGEHCRVHRVGWPALMALFLHSLADGLAIAFSFLSSAFLGGAVGAAVVAHKVSDGMTLAALFLEHGRSRRRTAGVLAVLASATPLGVFLGLRFATWAGGAVLAGLLGLAAGGFIYISMADILPRIHKSRDWWCWVLMLLGVVVSMVLPHP